MASTRPSRRSSERHRQSMILRGVSLIGLSFIAFSVGFYPILRSILRFSFRMEDASRAAAGAAVIGCATADGRTRVCGRFFCSAAALRSFYRVFFSLGSAFPLDDADAHLVRRRRVRRSGQAVPVEIPLSLPSYRVFNDRSTPFFSVDECSFRLVKHGFGLRCV